MSVRPVILSGGVGTRLWPMSRSRAPKQFQRLLGDRTMFEHTVERVAGRPDFLSPMVIASESHLSLIAAQLTSIGVEDGGIILEPMGRNTAAAVAIAALTVSEQTPEAILLILPSDHHVGDLESFHDAVGHGMAAARSGSLVTFGVRPTRPETGYGYVQSGGPNASDSKIRRVVRFVEKPEIGMAKAYLAAGDYLWNSGIFMFRADIILAEFERLCPEILHACRLSLDGASVRNGVVKLQSASFAACPAVPLDVAIMERTDRAVVVPSEFGWSDVGSWAALWDVGERDSGNNVADGEVLLLDTTNSLVASHSRLVAAAGVDGLVIVETADAVLVTTRERAQDVRALVERLATGEMGDVV